MANSTMTTGKNNINREVFESYSIPRALAKLAIPAIIGQLIILVYSLADTFYIGRANNPLMVAGVSLILPVFNISLSLAALAGVGGGTLISRLLGQGRDDDARKVSAFSVGLGFMLSVIFSLSMYLFMDPALRLFGASDATLPFARQYTFCVIVIGGIPTVVSMTLAHLLRGIGRAKEAGFGVSMGGVLNIILDPLFMFVLLPTGLEALGAGIATMLSNVIVCCYYLVTIIRSGAAGGLSLNPALGLPGRAEVKSIFSVGIPGALATLLFDLVYILIDKLAASYGDIPLAAVGIVLKAERLPLAVGIALCQGMMPLVGYNYAAKNFKRMRGTVNFSRNVGLLIGGISIILYEIFATDIMRFFIADAATVETGTHFLRARCLATPFMFMCFHLVNMFQALGLGKWTLVLVIARWAVFNTSLLFLFNAIFGMYGIVWTQLVADILTVVLSFIVYMHFERTILRSLDASLHDNGPINA